MSTTSLVRMYRYVFAGLLLIATIQTLLVEHDAIALAAIEIVAILLFLWRRTELFGAGLLLAVFAFAQALTVAHGQWPTHLLQYAATTIFIVLLDRSLRTTA